MIRRCIVAGALASTLFACDRPSPGLPAAPGGLPPLEGRSTSPQAAPHGSPQTQAMAPHGQAGLPPSHPPIGNAHGSPSSDVGPANEGAAFDPKQRLAGVIELPSQHRERVKTGDVVFLSVRTQTKPGEAPGTLLAVDKLIANTFPARFEIDGRKAMIAGTPFTGPVTLTVRVDKDGDPMTKNAGDVQGQAAVTIPFDKVVLKLDTVL